MAIHRVTCRGTYFGVEEWVNTFHVDRDDLTAPTLASIATAFSNAYRDGVSNLGWLQNCVPQVILQTIEVRNLESAEQPFVSNVALAGGSVASALTLPLDVAPVVSWQTAFIGRRFRGRTYLPTPVTTAMESGSAQHPRLTSVYRGAMADAAGALLVDLIALDAPLVVLSRVGAVPPSPGAATTITGGYIDSEPDTQRRRGKSLPTVRTQFSDT